MSISALSLGSAAYTPKLQSEPAMAKQQNVVAAADPDHDGDVDGAGPDRDSGRTLDILA